MDFLIIFFYLLIGADIILTNHTLSLLRKKNCLDMSLEINWLPRLIMNGNPGKWAAVRGVTVNLILFTVLLYLVQQQSPLTFYYSLSVLIGAFSIVNYVHIANIKSIFKNWDNEPLWKLRREMTKVKMV